MSMRSVGFLLYMIGVVILQTGTALIWIAPNE